MSRRTSLDVGDATRGLGTEELKASVEGSITRRPPGVPPEPLKLLRVMVDLIGGVTRQLREEIFKHSHSEQVSTPAWARPRPGWTPSAPWRRAAPCPRAVWPR